MRETTDQTDGQMIDRQEQIELVEDVWPRPPLELEAEGHFHFIMGTKDEHDGVKVFASNPHVIRALLADETFRPEQYYCTLVDESRQKVEPEDLADWLDEIDAIHAIDGMLPYEAVTISLAEGGLTAADVLDIDDE